MAQEKRVGKDAFPQKFLMCAVLQIWILVVLTDIYTSSHFMLAKAFPGSTSCPRQTHLFTGDTNFTLNFKKWKCFPSDFDYIGRWQRHNVRAMNGEEIDKNRVSLF